MGEEVTKEQIEEEKKTLREKISKEEAEMINKGLKEAKALEKDIKKEPFPDEESLLDEQHKLVKMEKNLDSILEPREIKKPDHHLEEAEKVEIKKKEKKK